MRSDPTGAPEQVAHRVEREINEVRAAITMVASGAATSISLNGLHFGDVLLERLRTTATEQGVVLEPRWWPFDAGCDITVRRIA